VTVPIGREPDEWIGGKPRPLSSAEVGRGVALGAERLEEIERFCVEAMRAGWNQERLRRHFGATKSRVSRWCIDGLRKHGETTDHRHLRRGTATLTQMVWARIDVRGTDDCWPWRGSIKPNGYGSINYKGRAYNAHRLVFDLLVAAIPDGLVIDHKCANKTCCNPSHLQIVGPSMNLLLHYVRAA
jgi:hypothetical protein